MKTPERDGAAVEAIRAVAKRLGCLYADGFEDGSDCTCDAWFDAQTAVRALKPLIAAREAVTKAEALREAAEEWPKMRGSHTRSDVAQWLRDRADREAP